MASRSLSVRVSSSTSRLLSSRSRGTASPLSRGVSANRIYTTDSSPPPLLTKLKGDLKMAIKTKDAARLTVVRSVLAATLNLSKTDQPIKTDAQLVALLRKTVRTSQDAVQEFQEAGRNDLAEKEKAQIRVLEEYAQSSGIKTLGPAELQVAAEGVLADLSASDTVIKNKASEVIKRLLAPGGPLDGKDFSKAEMALVVKRLTATE